jgi:hypothetical protein
MKEVGCALILQYVLPFPERYDTLPEASIEPVKHKFIHAFNYDLKAMKSDSPEQVRDYALSLPAPETLEKNFNFEANYLAWAELMSMREKYMHDMVWVPGHVARPTDFMFYFLFGYEPYLMALQLYKPEMKILFDLVAENARLLNTAIAKSNVDHKFIDWIYLGEDICDKTGPLCDPVTLREIYWPAVKKAVKPLKDAGIKLLWHCDGNIMPILKDLVDCGIDGLQGFETEAGVDLEVLSETRAQSGKKMVLFGSVSVTTTMPFGTVDDVKKQVEYIVDLSKRRGGGIVLSASSSILDGTPDENIYPLFIHSREYSSKVFA